MTETIQDIINKKSKKLSTPLDVSGGFSFEDDPLGTLRAIQSGEVQDAILQDAHEGSILGDTAGAFGIGAANMLNNTLVGGTGLVLGGLGRGVEAISPFSGRDDELYNQLLDIGTPAERVDELAPYQDSWLTSAAKGTLSVQNSIDDTLKDWRNQIIGENPSTLAEIFEGSGSSIGFLLAGLLLGHTPLAAASIAGGFEALSEAGGFLGDAYRQGQYDNGALSTAGKNLLANMGLNTGLNYTVGRFNPKVDAIKNPFKRWAIGGLAEIGNELLQEPSQQIIEQASQNSLQNGTGFMSELGQSAKNWPEMFMQVAPTVAASTALTQLLLGAGALSTRGGRQNIATQSVLSRYDTIDKDLGNNEKKTLLQTYQPDMDVLRRLGIQDLQAKRDAMQEQLYNAYADYGTDVDINPEAQTDVQDLLAKIQRLDSDINDYLNPPKPIIETDTAQNASTSDVKEEIPTPNKKARKRTNSKEKVNEAELKPSNYENPDDNIEENERLSDFVPTSDTVRAYEAKNKLGSNTARIRTAKGTEVDVRYRIVDVDDLIASTKETGAPNPAYPQELQPRQRNRDASFAQIDKISRTLDPELLGANRLASDGAPVIGSDMVVESGNGRVLALRQAYKINNSETYKAWLRDNAEMFGLSPDEVDSVAKPVLVRERITDVDRVKFTSEANEASIASMSSSEHALDDAKLITSDMLYYYDPEKPLEGNLEFVSRVIARMPENERGDLIQTDGKFSLAGFERVRNALAAKAYKDASVLNRLSEIFDDEVKNISNALIQAAPQVAIFEDVNQKPENSISEDIKQAVSLLVDLRNRKIKVDEFIAQPPLIDDVETEGARKLLAFFNRNKRSAKRIAQGIMNYAEIAREQANPNQMVMFEDSVRSKADMLDEAIARAENSDSEISETTKTKKNKSSQPETRTKNFKRFFGDWEKSPKKASKVVDDSGAPLIVYRGTSKGDTIIDGKRVRLFNGEGRNDGLTGDTRGTGIWFHSSAKAAGTYGEHVYPCYLNIRNPYIYDAKGKNPKTVAKKKDQIVRDVRAGKYGEGYDGVIFHNMEDVMLYFNMTPEEAVGDIYVAFNRNQVKSIENNGQWGDVENIYEQSSNEEPLRLNFKQKLIDAGRSEDEAEQLSHVYLAGNRYFSKYTGIPLDKIIEADNIRTEQQELIDNDETIRARTILKREQRDVFGDIISEAQTILQFSQNADESSGLHETAGHVFLNKFKRLASSGQLKGLAKQDWNTLVKELGIQDIDFSKPLSKDETARWTEAHEKFSAIVEKYFMTGEAPNSKMKHIFETFKRWLKTIYQSLKNIQYVGTDGKSHHFDLSPEFKQILDHIYGEGNENTQNENNSFNQKAKSDANFVDTDNIEQYQQRYFYPSGRKLKNQKFDLADTGIDKNNFAWGIFTTEFKLDAQKHRQGNTPLNKKGAVHFIDKYGDDIEEMLHKMRPGKEREALDRLITDLKWEINSQDAARDLSAIKEKLRKRYLGGKGAPGMISRIVSFLNSIKSMTRDETSQGNLYEVEGPDDKLLLDWDTPLEEQPEAIQKAARGIEEQLKLWGIDLYPTPKGKLFSVNLYENITGRKFYEKLVTAMQAATIRDLIHSKKFGKIRNPKMAASLMLYRFGIPGAKAKAKIGRAYSLWDTTLLKVLGISKDSTDEATKPYRDKLPQPEPEEEKTVPIRLIGRGAGEGYDRTKIVDVRMGDESYNQIGGKNAVRNLDEAEGHTWRQFNLKRAMLMNKAGKDARTIKRATGWELAPDGEWRMEFEDGKIIPDKFREIMPVQRSSHKKVFKSSELNRQYPIYAKLSNFFDAPVLFKAYPELKDVVVCFTDKLPSKVGGVAYGLGKDLDRNIDIAAGRNLRDTQSSILHEIQHLIQDIEGFAEGGSMDHRVTLKGAESRNIGSELLYRLLKQASPETRQFAMFYLKGNFKEANKIARAIPSEERKYIRNLKKVINDIKHNKRLDLGDDYYFLGGEIEARNVEHRQSLSNEERRDSLLSDTEDFHSWIVRRHKDDALSSDEAYNQIGAKRKQDMDAALTRHRPDMSPQQRADAISEIEKLGESVKKGGNSKVEKTAQHWLLKGHIILPEDNYKILDAIKICEQQHLNPMSFDDPNEILAKYTIKEKKGINPDTVPEFSNKVEYDNGITVYTVEDTKAGQLAVRRIIDTHWGEDANPWCLVARIDGSLDNAWGNWNYYGEIPKRIAFQNGKLLSFCASDERDITWWNREDKPSKGIPYTVKEHGNTRDYGYDEKTGKSKRIQETLKDGTKREYYENEQLMTEKLPDGTIYTYCDNEPIVERPDGIKHGPLSREELPNKILREYYSNGLLLSESKPDGTYLQYFRDGKVVVEANGIKHGPLMVEDLEDGTRRSYYANGQLRHEELPDRTSHSYRENGQLWGETLSDGTDRTYYNNGLLKIECLPDGMINEYYDSGPIVTRPDGIRHGPVKNDGDETYNQAAFNPRGTLGKLLGGIVKRAKSIFVPSAPAIDTRKTDSLKFSSEETEKRYSEAKKGVQKPSIISRVKHSAQQLIRSLKGDFPDLSGKDAERKGLLFAKEQFRMLQKAKSAQVQNAMQSFTDNLRGLSDYQLDLFTRKRLLDDLTWRKQNYPDAELPFGFSEEMLKKEAERFRKLVDDDDTVRKAIQTEEKTMQSISSDFIKLAGDLGLNLEGVLRNPHYYRHTILEYANAAALGQKKRTARNDESLQDFVDAQLRGITNRSYLKHYKGSPLDISANYVQANGEVRAQMLMDIEAMKTLLKIKKKYDIAPKLKGKLKNLFSQQQETDIETHNQPGDTDTSLSDIIPEGYSLFDPAGTRLIQSANSAAENIISMAVDDAATQSGLPLDKLLQTLGDFGDEAINRLLVLPDEIISSLNSMSRTRDRGMLGNAAKVLTNWWKKAVLFSPTRNIKYNIRNFTGDIDALIAGNPQALKFLPQSVKELTAHMRGKNTAKELQNYLERAGGMNIESMQLTFADIEGMQNWADDMDTEDLAGWKNIPKKGWSLIKSFFKNEVAFTTWREHLLRYAAYLHYLQDMKQHKGTPSSWGASLKQEVMSLDDIHDRAYKMSNELLGAYNEVSEFGKQLRDLAIPFWSWSEINMKRYYRLLKNGLSGANSSDFAKRFMMGKMASVPFYALSAAETFGKISLFTLLAQAFNRFVFPDEDDDLPPEVKYKPHLTFGKVNGRVYYFDRIGALADTAEWGGLDSIFLDAIDIKDGRLSWADYMKKIISAPAGKILNEVNPLFRMPYELATGRTIFPDVSHPRTIKDKGQHIAQSFGLSWPYKAATGQMRDDWNEFKNIFTNSADADEAAYFYSIDRVRQFQERVLGKKSEGGFAQIQRGQVLQRLKQALRFHDKGAVRQLLKEYKALDGTDKGLKSSMRSMNPLYGLSKDEQKKFLRWLSQDDRRYLNRANKYFHQLADRYLR